DAEAMKASLSLFCDECGAGNPAQATTCFACHRPLHAPLPAQATQTQVQAQVSVGQTTFVTPAAADALVPLLHQRYTISSEIGQGGFGLVYKAKDNQSKNKL